MRLSSNTDSIEKGSFPFVKWIFSVIYFCSRSMSFTASLKRCLRQPSTKKSQRYWKKRGWWRCCYHFELRFQSYRNKKKTEITKNQKLKWSFLFCVISSSVEYIPNKTFSGPITLSKNYLQELLRNASLQSNDRQLQKKNLTDGSLRFFLKPACHLL